MSINIELEEVYALKLYKQIYWRRRWSFLATGVIVMGSMAVYTLTQTKIYESSLLLLVNSEDNARSNPGDFKQAEVLQTVPLLSSAAVALHQRYPKLNATSIASHLRVQQLGHSGTIGVTYRDSDPTRLIQVLSQLGKTYVDFSLTNRRLQVSNAIDSIEQTLPEAEQSFAQRAQQLETFREQHHFTDPHSPGADIMQALSSLDDQERSTAAALHQNLALYQNLEQHVGLLPIRTLVAASLSQDLIYLDLLKQYQETENKYTLGQTQFKEDSPQLQNLKAKRNQLNQLLQNRGRQLLNESLSQLVGNPHLNEVQIARVSQLLKAKNIIQVQQASLAAIQMARRGLEKKLQILPTLQQQDKNLFQQIEVTSNSSDRLLSKLQELHTAEAREAVCWKIVQPPYPVGAPVEPNITLNLMLGSVLTLLCGGSVVFLREYFANRFKSIYSLREMLAIPILGVVPQTDDLPSDDCFVTYSTEAARKGQQSGFRSAFQNILFSLCFIDIEEPIKAVGITSSVSQEGKSTIVKHLGLTAAKRGYRVLLVDGDLCKPELHLTTLKVSNEQGLSNILTTGISWQEVIQDTAQEGLQVLTAGPILPNSLALLDSNSIGQLMNQLRECYDFVFVDLPPVLGATDSLMVATHLDGLALTISFNLATRENLKASLESLSRIPSRLIGAICNMSMRKG